MGLSLREVEALLDRMGADRCHQAIWQWKEALANTQSDPPTATPSRVAFDEKSYDRTIVVDYKDEYAGLVESGLLERLAVPPDATALDRDGWAKVLASNDSLQLARAGCTDEGWREAVAALIEALADLEESVFLGIDEAHRIAPQRGGYPDPIDTLATTYHGDGMGVAWVSQRWSKLDEDVVSQQQASMLGGFRSSADLDKIESIVEYPVAVHKSDAD